MKLGKEFQMKVEEKEKFLLKLSYPQGLIISVSNESMSSR